MQDHFDLSPAQWQTLRGLLDEAMALEGDERARWLDGLQGERAAFRSRLAALLEHARGSSAQALLETLPKVETGQFAPAPPPAERVGPYRLIRELGSGGMASVWLAERTDMLKGRQVALKLPHGAWKRAGLAERLQREREILATLEHPNIARLYDAGVADDGQPWLALEYVAGERIDAWCERHALDVPARLRLFLQVARAVAHAHANLVVHRDLKPSNILVTGDAEVKLLDFGIAKLLEQGEAHETELTQQAGRALTPEYAAPEQILGRAIGTAADVYALGVVLYELLAGCRPYALERDSRAALEEAILQVDAAPPSARAPAGRRAALRGDLDTIVLKALRKDPTERYATVAAFAEDIERHLSHRPVLAQPEGGWYRFGKFVRRNRGVALAATAVVVTTLTGTVLSLWQARVAERERDAALREQVRSEAFAEFLRGLLSDVGIANRPASVGDLLQRATEVLRQRDDLDVGTAAYLQYETSRLYTAVMQTGRELELLSLAAEGARRIGDHDLVAAALCASAWTTTYRDRALAERHMAEAEAALVRSAGPTVAALADCSRARARLHQAAGNLDAAIEEARRGLAALDQLGTRAARVRRGALATQLADFYRASDRYAEAIALAEEELENVRRSGGAGSVLEHVALNNIAGNLSRVGEVRRATEILEERLRWFERLPTAGVQGTGFRTNVAANFVWMGRASEALRLVEEDRQAAQAAGNPFALAMCDLIEARALHALGRVDEAQQRLAGAMAFWQRDERMHDRLLREGELLRAELLMSRGDAAQARGRVDAMLGRLGYPGRNNAPGLDRVLRLRARIAMHEGDFAGAERSASDALAVSRRLARDIYQSADVGHAALLRAEALRARGDRAGALRDLALARVSLTNGMGAGHALSVRASQLERELKAS